MEVALGNSKDYSLKRYLLFVTKLQKKSKVSLSLSLSLSDKVNCVFSLLSLIHTLAYSRIFTDNCGRNCPVLLALTLFLLTAACVILFS